MNGWSHRGGVGSSSHKRHGALTKYFKITNFYWCISQHLRRHFLLIFQISEHFLCSKKLCHSQYLTHRNHKFIEIEKHKKGVQQLWQQNSMWFTRILNVFCEIFKLGDVALIWERTIPKCIHSIFLGSLPRHTVMNVPSPLMVSWFLAKWYILSFPKFHGHRVLSLKSPDCNSFSGVLVV